MMEVRKVGGIAFDDGGHGVPALLMLPGWCGGREVMAPLASRCRKRRRVVTLDLRGHGESEAGPADFGAGEVLADVVAVLEAVGTEPVVPVALSHAGWLALELRRRLGASRVPGIVLVDWMVLGPPPGFLEAVAALQEPQAWEAVRAELARRWTDGVDEPAVHDYVLSMMGYGHEAWARAGREIGRAFAAEPTPLEALAALDPACPTLHLYAQPRDDAYLAAQQQATGRRGWFAVERLEATSHFPMFEVPDRMAGSIESFVASLTAAAVGR